LGNRQASGGAAWARHDAVKIRYVYEGLGLKGEATSLTDLGTGRFVDSAAAGPATQSQGFDGENAWTKDPSGAVTVESGGDARQLAVNEAYRRANLWWRPDYGGAAVASDGAKPEGAATYDVLTITPKGGKPFDAWFDARSHLLWRIVEAQGPQRTTSTRSEYRPFQGVELPGKVVLSTGDPKYDETLTVASVQFGPAEPASAFAPPRGVPADSAIEGGAAETTVPFRLLNNHVYAEVEVDGRPFTFLFDSGGQNLMTPETAKALGLKSQGSIQGSGAGEGHLDFGLTRIDSLRIGKAVVKDQVFPVVSLAAIKEAEGAPLAGVVGFETFRRFVTRFDYGAGTITFIDPKRFDPSGAGAAIPFAVDGTNIVVEGSFQGHRGSFIVDTGSRDTITFSAPFARANNITAGSSRSVTGVTGWGFGGVSRGTVMRAGPFAIGPYVLDRPIVSISTDKGGTFTDASIAGNIGGGLFKRFVVTLDYERSKMYLKPVASPVEDLDTYDRAGLWINQGAAGFKVIDVIAGSPASEAGLKAGEVIVAVDGAPAGQIALSDLRRRLRTEAPGTVVTFTVEDGAARREVRITLRDLV
jgi:hypothetical protein